MLIDDPRIKEGALPFELSLLREMVDEEGRPFVAPFLGLVAKHAITNSDGVLETEMLGPRSSRTGERLRYLSYLQQHLV